ncbi:MAG TPA: hypothetical protein VGY76_11820 [Solirubrobacteraceae bacterium]|jgi:hypothetical protein|nr:hypothetical protein [Solirubrobacteraceae bacterium]
MRLLWTLLAALLPMVAAGALPAAAEAAQTAKLKAGFSPYRLGRSTTVKLGLEIGVAGASDGLPSPVTRFEMRIPANLELIGSSLGLSICHPEALLANGPDGCPADARLGLGSAQIKVPVGPEPVTEGASIEAEMGPPVGEEIGVLLYAEAGTPVAAQLIFPGVLFGGASQSLSTAVPLIPSLPGAPYISMVSMKLSLGPEGLTYFKTVHGRTVGYHPEGIALPAHCPRGGFRFVSSLQFADGSSASAASTVPCPSRRR